MFRRRRPLLRAAAIGGGAYALGSHRAAGRQQAASQDQESQPAAPAAPASPGISSESVEKLTELGKLHEQGVLTDAEFTDQKERLLAG